MRNYQEVLYYTPKVDAEGSSKILVTNYNTRRDNPRDHNSTRTSPRKAYKKLLTRLKRSYGLH